MDEIEKEFIDLFQTYMNSMGLDGLSCRLVAILYIEPGPLSMDDLMGMTSYSRASISNCMRILEKVGVVSRVRRPGTKKAFFYMEKDIVKLNRQKIVKVRENFMNPLKKSMPSLITKFREKELDERSTEKLRIIEGYYTQVIGFEKVLDHLEEDLENISTHYANKEHS